MKARPSSKSRALKAFTLVELLVVLLLIAVLAGLASPRLKRSFEEMALSFAVRDLEKAIRYGQYRAVLDGLIYRLSLDRSRSRYQLQRKRLEKDALFEKIPQSLGRERPLPRGVVFGPMSDESVLFFPDGSSTRGSVILKREGGDQISIKLDPAYGGFKIAKN